MRKKYNTPHRSRVVKTRLSEDEYADFTARLAPYGISQSEFLRQAIRRATIRPVVHVSSVNDELLSAVGKLTAEYGRIGGNLNQIARYRCSALYTLCLFEAFTHREACHWIRGSLLSPMNPVPLPPQGETRK